jgi:hypothetical protein
MSILIPSGAGKVKKDGSEDKPEDDVEYGEAASHFDISDERMVHNQHTFKLVFNTKDRDMYLRADNSTEAHDWVHALNAINTRSKAQRLSTKSTMSFFDGIGLGHLNEPSLPAIAEAGSETSSSGRLAQTEEGEFEGSLERGVSQRLRKASLETGVSHRLRAASSEGAAVPKPRPVSGGSTRIFTSHKELGLASRSSRGPQPDRDYRSSHSDVSDSDDDDDGGTSSDPSGSGDSGSDSSDNSSGSDSDTSPPPTPPPSPPSPTRRM